MIDNHCINKNKPELNCHGKCYLKKELKVEKKTETTPKSLNNTYFFSFTFYQNVTQEFNLEISTLEENRFFYHQIQSNPTIELISDPPENRI